MQNIDFEILARKEQFCWNI